MRFSGHYRQVKISQSAWEDSLPKIKNFAIVERLLLRELRRWLSGDSTVCICIYLSACIMNLIMLDSLYMYIVTSWKCFLSLQFHDTYCKICTRRKVSQLGQEDFLGLCNILETRGLLGIKRAKDTRSMKASYQRICFQLSAIFEIY